jgi:hypothetical protein
MPSISKNTIKLKFFEISVETDEEEISTAHYIITRR